MAGIMDTIKDATNDGALLSLGAVALVAGLGAANQAGYYDRLPGGVKIPGVGSSNDDGWWGDAPGQWETFGQEFETFGSPSHGSRAKKKGSKKKGSKKKGKKSAYNQFVAQRIPQLVAQGQTPKRAMKVAAREWSAQSSW